MKGILIAFSAVAFVVLLSGCMEAELKDCGNDMTCFMEAAMNCTPAKVNYIQGEEQLGVEGMSMTIYMEVSGGTKETCNSYFQLSDITMPPNAPQEALDRVNQYKGADMRCVGPVSIFNENTFADYCEGTLKDLGVMGQQRATADGYTT